MTPEDIRKEHELALKSLTATQRRALQRVADANQLTNFNGKPPKQNLNDIFIKEAEDRQSD